MNFMLAVSRINAYQIPLSGKQVLNFMPLV